MGNIPGLCNMRGNCELWGFTKTENGYKQILRHEWADDYKLSPKSANGFANIEIDANSSNGNFPNYLHVLKYDGKEYRMTDCFTKIEFVNNKELKKPKLVPEKCEQ